MHTPEMTRIFTRITLMALVLSSFAGCLVESDWNPTGTDGTLKLTWTVDGTFPSKTACDAEGISTVKASFFEFRSSSDAVTSSIYEAPCGLGLLGPYDVRAGNFFVRLEGFDSNGEVVATAPGGETDVFEINVGTGQNVVQPFNFGDVRNDPFIVDGSDAPVSFRWTIDSQSPTATVCSSAGIASVRAEISKTVGGEILYDGGFVAPCDEATFGTRDFQSGEYFISLIAVDQNGEEVFRTPDTHGFRLVVGTSSVTQAFNFGQSQANILATIRFENSYGSAMYSACAEGDVTQFDWVVKEDGTAIGNGVTTVQCDSAKTSYELDAPIQANKDYTLEIAGRTTNGEPDLWNATVSFSGNATGAQTLVPVDVVETVQPSILFNLKWGTFADCTDANSNTPPQVEGFQWQVVQSGNTVDPEGYVTETTCKNSVTALVEPGTWGIALTSAGTEKWGENGTCQNLVVEHGQVEAECMLRKQ